MPDQHGYPTTAEKRRLRKLAWNADLGSTLTTMEYLQSVWWHADWGITRGKRLLGRRSKTGTRYRRWRVSTGGWSGNEELVSILERSLFWAFCWQSSTRGGHYVFDVPEMTRGD